MAVIYVTLDRPYRYRLLLLFVQLHTDRAVARTEPTIVKNYSMYTIDNITGQKQSYSDNTRESSVAIISASIVKVSYLVTEMPPQ